MNYKIETTDTITPALRKMQNQKALAKTFKSATAKAGRLGVQQIKQNYRKTGIKHPNKAGLKSKYGNPMKGIKYITSKSDFLSFILSILGDYRLKWFEYGTSLRKNSSSIRRTKKGKVPTSKGQNRGIIRATPFFMSAIRQIKSQINKIYEESFEWAINKIINKK